MKMYPATSANDPHPAIRCSSVCGCAKQLPDDCGREHPQAYCLCFLCRQERRRRELENNP